LAAGLCTDQLGKLMRSPTSPIAVTKGSTSKGKEEREEGREKMERERGYIREGAGAPI